MVRSDVNGLHESGSWKFFAIGGATAHNMISENSETDARRLTFNFLDEQVGNKKIFLLFGEVDCANHIEDADGVAITVSRYKTFIEEIRQRPDVESVDVCAVYPRTSVFTMNDCDALQINTIIDIWNNSFDNIIDTNTPLRGDDGFLIPDFAHRATDPGERHLSKAGCDIVLGVIEEYCLRSSVD
jgi:hypothetical protein